MPRQVITEAMMREALSAMQDHGGNQVQAAKALNLPRGTLQHRVREAQRVLGDQPAAFKPRHPSEELDIPKPPDPNEPITDLIARKNQQYQRQEASRVFHKLVKIGVRDNGPVLICAIGDPHVDDDGCDLKQLIDDMTLIGRTKGAYALHLGDLTNNWVGRLGRLYAHQSTKASDGIRLAEHILKLAPPLALVGGNHDLWNEGMNWLTFVLRQASVDAGIVQAHGARMELAFPGGKSIRIHARHDFPGRSQYNPTHGGAREHAFGQRDHINISGHRHRDAVSASPSPDGYVHWTYQVSGYKAFDDYAAAIGAQEAKMGPTVALLINVNARLQAEVVKPFWDLQEAADWLAFKRKREAA
jgi:hypothetical protein